MWRTETESETLAEEQRISALWVSAFNDWPVPARLSVTTILQISVSTYTGYRLSGTMVRMQYPCLHRDLLNNVAQACSSDTDPIWEGVVVTRTRSSVQELCAGSSRSPWNSPKKSLENKFTRVPARNGPTAAESGLAENSGGQYIGWPKRPFITSSMASGHNLQLNRRPKRLDIE